MMQQQMTAANTPDPNLQRLMGINNSIIDWHTNPNNTVKDIYKNPTIGGQLPVFQMAKQNQDAGRIGRGIVGRTNMNKEGYASDLKAEDDANRSIAASGQLEMGLQNQLAGAMGNEASLTGMDYSRKTGQINNAMGGLSGYTNLGNSIANSGWGGFFRGLAGGFAGSV